MDYGITFKDIKKSNYSSIYHLLYKKGRLSKQVIATDLQLSLPTVTQNLVRLEKEGLIEKNGHFESEVGRRAIAYAVSSQARISIGVEIQKNKVKFLAVNLLGEAFEQESQFIDYVNEDDYYKKVSQMIESFISSLDVKNEQVLGIAIAVQAITSADGKKITYGKILQYTGLEITAFSKHLSFPCLFVHDAKGAATSELWVRNDIDDAVYLSIGTHLGGAVIINQQIYMGNEGHSGTVEHMSVNPDGPLCYCGKNGCMETYSSIQALLEEDESLEEFFQHLRAKEPSYVARWDYFLEYLAYSINNIHQVLNRDFILGGHISPYLIEDDINILHKKVYKKTAFPSNNPFISISHSPENSVPIGAAILFINNFLESI